jgi:hypothetical protein
MRQSWFYGSILASRTTSDTLFAQLAARLAFMAPHELRKVEKRKMIMRRRPAEKKKLLSEQLTLKEKEQPATSSSRSGKDYSFARNGQKLRREKESLNRSSSMPCMSSF